MASEVVIVVVVQATARDGDLMITVARSSSDVSQLCMISSDPRLGRKTAMKS